MANKILLILLFSVTAMAAPNTTVEKKYFEIPDSQSTDLLSETSTLKLNTEESVQALNPRSDFIFNLLAGNMSPKALTMVNPPNTINYNFTTREPLPLLTAQFEYLPFAFKWGKLGMSFSAGYSYSEFRQTTPTALHMFPTEAGLLYRGEFKSTQVVIPYLGVGPQGFFVFQRGVDQYNNSQFYRALAGTGGIAINMNRLGLYHSRTEVEVVFQYKKTWAETTALSDFNSNTYQIGGALSL